MFGFVNFFQGYYSFEVYKHLILEQREKTPLICPKII